MDTVIKLAVDEDVDEDEFNREGSDKLLVKSNQDLDQESPNSDKLQSCLPYLLATLFACVLEDALTQLRMLGECNNELRIIKTMTDISNLRAMKFKIKPCSIPQDPLAAASLSLDSMQHKLDKLAADRKFCDDILIGTYLELALDRCFNTMMATSQHIEDQEAYRMALADEEAKNKALRRELMKQLRQQRNHIKTVAYDTDLIIDQLKSKVEDAALNAETRGRYITNWQRARSEQHQQTIQDSESGPSENIEYYELRTSQEQRIHSEVELLVNIFINLAEHEILMANWIKFKDDRARALAYQQLMTKSAIIVQAWWRGLLVRLELGPYKKRKRK
ncbi:unnamed protein product [Chrysodeixis includens]|uniref:Dynein regulatory complex protein 9 n=1 Tax=Chrysodeixis includens TaxID=689277 RepID=A0A9P0BTW8_CHRIL|nr:unnamed protein product [Chrysodeixis includens]